MSNPVNEALARIHAAATDGAVGSSVLVAREDLLTLIGHHRAGETSLATMESRVGDLLSKRLVAAHEIDALRSEVARWTATAERCKTLLDSAQIENARLRHLYEQMCSGAESSELSAGAAQNQLRSLLAVSTRLAARIKEAGGLGECPDERPTDEALLADYHDVSESIRASLSVH